MGAETETENVRLREDMYKKVNPVQKREIMFRKNHFLYVQFINMHDAFESSAKYLISSHLYFRQSNSCSILQN
jgi:hypothetical protein